MKNPFRNLREIQRDVGDIAIQLTHVQLLRFGARGEWQPAINVFRCGDHFVICVDLAGVERSAIEVSAEPRRLVIRGSRPPPEPSCTESPAVHVLALEIDHGTFERVVELPADVEPERVAAEHRNGLLWVKLPLRAHG